ncbi:MAG TPA: hydrogenase maturation nickel metallochaperone HypA [Thermoplasmata archaeon]|nr:hydrogenase maturation nickel metallochaperone HypA [Thermoplasmata archaeon]
MHEQALVRDLLREVDRVARQHPGATVRRVDVWVGALAHLTEDGLRGIWSEASRGTVAAGAELGVELSSDRTDPRAQGVVLARLVVDDERRSDGRSPTGPAPRPSTDMLVRGAEG